MNIEQSDRFENNIACLSPFTRRKGRFGVLDNMCQFNIAIRYTDKLYNKSSTSYALLMQHEHMLVVKRWKRQENFDYEAKPTLSLVIQGIMDLAREYRI